jgi:hypothetical protein
MTRENEMQGQKSHIQNSQMQKNQMNASIASDQRTANSSPSVGFGRIGIPAVAAAAEIMRVKKPVEKPAHASFYLGSD